MIDLQKKITIDWTASSCCAACTIMFLAWTYSAIGTASLTTFAFFTCLPIAFYCTGTAALRWLGLRTRSVHPAPFALLMGSVLCTLVLFLVHLLLPLSLRVTEAILLAIAVIANFSSPPVKSNRRNASAPVAVASVLFALLAGTFWTQDIRPVLNRQERITHVKPWIDAIVHAQIVSQLHLDRTMLQLGDPDMAGRSAPVYHYASYMLPASVEAWNDDATALDSLVAFWIPFGVSLVALSAYCVAAEWGGELAGLTALAVVSLLPDPSTYTTQSQFYSAHWLLVVSPGLTYGIASSAAGLLLLSAGIRSNSSRLLISGLAVELTAVFFKAHIAIVSVPLTFTWIICVKRGWGVGRRVIALTALAAIGMLGAFLLDRLKIGFNLLPDPANERFIKYVQWNFQQVKPGQWRTWLEPGASGDASLQFWLRAVVFLTVEPLGAAILLWPVIAVICLIRRRTIAFDLVPLIALLIYLVCAFVFGPTLRGGTVDEVWHRPFVWLFFVFSAWCSVRLILFVPKRIRQSTSALNAGIVCSAVLLLHPLASGKSVQVSDVEPSRFTNIATRSGLLDCAAYIRDNADPYDIVQSDEPSDYPWVSCFAERRSYLGRSVSFWQQFFQNTQGSQAALVRNHDLFLLKTANSEMTLRQLVEKTGIRWYLARPNENLAWPAARLHSAVFESDGFCVYDLATGK